MSQAKSTLPVYHTSTLEFVTVAKSYCDFLDQLEGMDKAVFLDTMAKLLPLVYIKASLLPKVDLMLDEAPETFASEDQYALLTQVLADLLGNDDVFLEVFHPDIQLSDTPVASFISENLADIWQDLYNFISIFRIGYEDTMNDALHLCRSNFENFWGQSLVNVLRALHHCIYSKTDQDDFEVEGEEAE